MTVFVRTSDWAHHPVEFETETTEQAVGYLWKMAFVQNTDPDAYMVEVARRVKMYNRKVIRTDSALNFLLDMSAAGLITVRFTEEEPHEPQA